MRTRFFVSAFSASILFLAVSNVCCGALVAHYTGDGTFNDSSGNDYHGGPTGNTTFATGVHGQAFSFDGNNDDIRIANSSDLEPAILTVSLWLKIPDTVGIQRLIIDSSHGFVDQKGWALQTNPDGSIALVFGDDSTFHVVSSTTLIDDDQFHHITGVKDASNLLIYVDGNLENTLPYTWTAAPSGRTLRIGTSWGGNNLLQVRDVEGLIDDVRIYDNALSQSQVLSLASAVPEPSSTALMLLCGIGTLAYRRRFPTARSATDGTNYMPRGQGERPRGVLAN
ncbi:hypothetical protein CA13_36750 [Planctomycetes bacterium CA13]|uniref:LamG-like jellyroll fold domain-containing protein n=1 Tax=Novipirellula herctigrandis TaxID=2527986 RepID=A0A5C5Z4J7_9BACT|nr:hypothetical protein CA13_36750 [Planctomycetes bacterium CA13]